MKEAKKFINKHSVPAQDAEHYFGHNERVVDVTTAKEAIKMAYEAGLQHKALKPTRLLIKSNRNRDGLWCTIE